MEVFAGRQADLKASYLEQVSKEGWKFRLHHLSIRHGIFYRNDGILDKNGDIWVLRIDNVGGLSQSTVGFNRESVEVQLFLQIGEHPAGHTRAYSVPVYTITSGSRKTLSICLSTGRPSSH